MTPNYAELHCLTNYSFLRGASDPEELVHRASELGYSALAVTDECSVSGIVRAHVAAKDTKVKLIVGSEITLADGLKLVLLVKNIGGYETLCELITKARRAAKKGEYRLERADFPESTQGLIALWIPSLDPGPSPASAAGRDDEGRWVAERFPGNAWIGVELHRGADDAGRIARLEALGRELGMGCVAAGDVHMHVRGRKRLQDVMGAIRLKCTLAEAGRRLQPNGERHLRPIGRLSAFHPARLLAATLDVASRCTFSLDEIRYEYPEELVPAGETPTTHLRSSPTRGWRGAIRRAPPSRW
jgi:error-prone DNA polymerase